MLDRYRKGEAFIRNRPYLKKLCLKIAFLAIAENSKLDIVSFKAGATGKLEKLNDRGFALTEIALHPTVVINNACDFERANRILEKAEKHCLIFNQIKSNTKLESQISFAR